MTRIEMSDRFPAISEQVFEERIRQISKWGDDPLTPEVGLRVLVEEVGEIAKAMNDGDWANYRVELVQVAAVCYRMIQSFDIQSIDKAGQKGYTRDI